MKNKNTTNINSNIITIVFLFLLMSGVISKEVFSSNDNEITPPSPPYTTSPSCPPVGKIETFSSSMTASAGTTSEIKKEAQSPKSLFKNKLSELVKIKNKFANCIIDYDFNNCPSYTKKNKNYLTPYHTAVLEKNASKKILFLGDLEKDDPEDPWISGAKTLKNKFFDSKSGITLYQTDYELRDKVISENLVKQHIDHNLKFPFSENEKFDAIVMKRGLCHCDKDEVPKTCGGIDCSLNFADQASAYSFVKKVIASLNIKNPSSFAVLQGAYGNNTKDWKKFWEALVKEVSQRSVDVDIDIIYDENNDFYALLITPTLSQLF
ncbi:MAG: hypothetical protein HQK51_18390 [Oligoflexia bacterium]|nr:hypothetical protein [Oligoflexia bacterium]